MSNVLDKNPIINNAYEEPTKHWHFSADDQPEIREGRRKSTYLSADRKQVGLDLGQQTEEDLGLVNIIRERVGAWRKKEYPGVTRITQELLKHWNDNDKEMPLFFAQREAMETTIWLAEGPKNETADILARLKSLGSIEKINRICFKMATGTGKTFVMAMLIAWQSLNKIHYRQDKRFSDSFLVVCPNLTVKERLQVLYPTNLKNYYVKFDLVPASFSDKLMQAKIFVTNWHLFAPKDEIKNAIKTKENKYEESDTAFASRALKELGRKENIVVLNDEAHHCYRCNPEGVQATKRTKIDPENKVQIEEATIWVQGLEKIFRTRGILQCFDLSATPFYISGSGFSEGTPFPWVVSDFGLLDAIESGLVKIPQIPTADNTGGEPKYRNLWEHIRDKAPTKSLKEDKEYKTGAAFINEVHEPLKMLAGSYKKTFDEWVNQGNRVPPCMIIVCNNTGTAEIIHKHVADGKVIDEFKNANGNGEYSLRIDSELLSKAEEREEGETQQDLAERLRKKVSTVGKIGEAGEQIRCVVSVAMLSEGWDAQNVTHILGVRAFTSRLLCEQVIGRALRCSSYDDLSQPEYAQIFGVPFEMFPIATTTVGPKPPKTLTYAHALAERQEMEIICPQVGGYIADAKFKVETDWSKVEKIPINDLVKQVEIAPDIFPSEKYGKTGIIGKKEVIKRNFDKRLQSTLYEIAATITNNFNLEYKRFLFPQILNITKKFVDEYIKFPAEIPKTIICEPKYKNRIIELLNEIVKPGKDEEEKLMPIFDNFKPFVRTRDVKGWTTKEVYRTSKSHVSHVVVDSDWEKAVCIDLEKYSKFYVKNYKLGFVIPYLIEGEKRSYEPDFIIVMPSGENLILEIKGQKRNDFYNKKLAAERWIEAVNNFGDYGSWKYGVCSDINELRIFLK